MCEGGYLAIFLAHLVRVAVDGAFFARGFARVLLELALRAQGTVVSVLHNKCVCACVRERVSERVCA